MATAKKSYFQKLLDPRWQKKRLEVLSNADWTCQSCMATDETLHVHHKQYFKGKEPWEYETEQLTVLCKVCHELAHDDVDPLLWVASFAPTFGKFDRFDAAWLLAGFIEHPLDIEDGASLRLQRRMSFCGALAREMAWLIPSDSKYESLGSFSPEELAKVALDAMVKAVK